MANNIENNDKYNGFSNSHVEFFYNVLYTILDKIDSKKITKDKKPLTDDQYKELKDYLTVFDTRKIDIDEIPF
jgi:hypothetical protein